jgi:hypothetical protein
MGSARIAVKRERSFGQQVRALERFGRAFREAFPVVGISCKCRNCPLSLRNRKNRSLDINLCTPAGNSGRSGRKLCRGGGPSTPAGEFAAGQ